MHLVFWMERIADGTYRDPDSATKSVAITKHFQLLSRELGLELVRRDRAPDAPSRMTCLWTTQSCAEAARWSTTLGGSGRVARLSATGVIHVADASLMSGDSESHAAVVENAQRYWSGDSGPFPHIEVLFAGSALVTEVLA